MLIAHSGKLPVSESENSVHRLIMQKKFSDCNSESEKNILIGVRLREERDRLKLSQLALTNYLGVTSRTQSEYEKGNNFPKADYLAQFQSLGADVLYILTGERAVGVVSDEEATLLAALRAAPPTLQHAAFAAAHGVLASVSTSTVTIQGDVGVQVSGGTHSFGNIQVGGKK